MSKSASVSTGSFPIFGILGLIFITLKLCHVIDWSWWWVLAPFWGVALLVIMILSFVVVILGLVAFQAVLQS